MANKFMYNHNDTQITPSRDYNKLLKRFDTELNEPKSQNLKKCDEDQTALLLHHF